MISAAALEVGWRSGPSLPVVGGMLGHSQPRTTAIYARLCVDPIRAAAEAAADAMLAHGRHELLDPGPRGMEATMPRHRRRAPPMANRKAKQNGVDFTEIGTQLAEAMTALPPEDTTFWM